MAGVEIGENMASCEGLVARCVTGTNKLESLGLWARENLKTCFHPFFPLKSQANASNELLDGLI